jgi:hypothetical protein
MDLFQPVTLHVGANFDPIFYKNLRLAVIAVMTELAPAQREKSLIWGKEGRLGIAEITQIYQDLKPLTLAQNGWSAPAPAGPIHVQ